MSQQAELARVQDNIGDLVEKFVLTRWQTGQPQFYMRELQDYIAAATVIAPASPDRILRQLRLDGKFDYQVVSRHESCYRITTIGSSSKKPAKKKGHRPELHQEFPIELVQHLVSQGYDFECGPHARGIGFYAHFYRDSEATKCDFCDEPASPSFKRCGHGDTVTDAIFEAADIAAGIKTGCGRDLDSFVK